MRLPFSVKPYGDMLLLQDARGITIAPFHVTEKKLALKLAAAPELYDALERAGNTLQSAIWQCLRELFDNDDDLRNAIADHVVIKQVRAALAKARGEAA